MTLNELEEKGLSQLEEDTCGMSWTQQSEMVEELESCGYNVKVVRPDFVVVTNKDSAATSSLQAKTNLPV